MAGESAVNRAAMAQAAVQVDDAVSTIQGLRSQLDGYQGSLMGGWQGDAAQAFAGAYESFNADFARVISALQGIQEKLVRTRATYESTEETNVGVVGKVSGLNG